MKLPSPQDTGVLCARVNCNNALPIYAGPGWKCLTGKECLITDITTEIDKPDLIRSSVDLVTWTQLKFPNALVGVYFSSRDAEDADLRAKSIYQRACHAELFDESELLPDSFVDPGPRRIVDYRQPFARAKLIRFTVDHCLKHKAQICYSDNWSHNASWPGYIEFQDTISYMRDLRKTLNAQGILLIVNLAMFQSLNESDAGALSLACDAVSFEDPVPRNWCNDAQGVQRIVRLKKLITARNCRVIDIPEAQIDPATNDLDKPRQDAECTFNAGEAMLFDGVYVAYLFYWDRPEWADWPTEYGKPKGDIKWLDAMRATRQFANGLLTVDFEKRTAVWQ